MAELTTLESLLEMGFDRNRAEKAVANTGNQGIEQAMDWLMEHENDPDIDEPYVPPAGNVLGGEPQSLPSTADSSEGQEGQESFEGMSLKGQERKQETEKKEHKRYFSSLFSISVFYHFWWKQEQLGLLFSVKFGGIAPSSTAASSQPGQPSPSSPTSQGPPPTKKEYDESRIQVRLLDGSTITTVFKAQEPLAAVRVYVQMNGNTPEGQDFTLLSPYPRHVYTELDMEKPLKELGLVPSAVLVVAKK
uniref:UBX domain protein 1 n=1 Tax=Neolamprologus brichardi TaxID=32507 RepID=A0A3Q4GB85_NEOBR